MRARQQPSARAEPSSREPPSIDESRSRRRDPVCDTPYRRHQPPETPSFGEGRYFSLLFARSGRPDLSNWIESSSFDSFFVWQVRRTTIGIFSPASSSRVNVPLSFTSKLPSCSPPHLPRHLGAVAPFS